MFSNKDVDQDVTVVTALAPGAFTADQTSAAIDIQAYRKVLVLFHVGTVTDGELTPTITSSTTSGGSYATESNISGTLSTADSADDEKTIAVAVNPSLANRFIKVALTETSASTGWDAAITVIGFKKTV